MMTARTAQPSYEIDIHVEEGCWPYTDIDLPNLAQTGLTAICAHMDVRPFSEISIAMVSSEKIKTLNKQYRGKDKTTNVLSFPASTDGSCPLLGDIVLAFDVVSSEAGLKNISIKDHMLHLLIHGFLHLQSYDHETNEDAKVMEALEIKALAGLGIANPYARDDES